LRDFNGFVFEVLIIGRNGGYENSFHDIGWKSFDKQVEYFIVSLGVASIATEFFELRDVVINFWELYATIFKLRSGSVFFLGILILFCKFMQELIPYVWDVVIDWIKSVQEIPYIMFPSGDLGSVHKGESESNFLDR